MSLQVFRGHNAYFLTILHWRQRSGAPHPMKRIPDARFAEVPTILKQIVQLA